MSCSWKKYSAGLENKKILQEAVLVPTLWGYSHAPLHVLPNSLLVLQTLFLGRHQQTHASKGSFICGLLDAANQLQHQVMG